MRSSRLPTNRLLGLSSSGSSRSRSSSLLLGSSHPAEGGSGRCPHLHKQLQASGLLHSASRQLLGRSRLPLCSSSTGRRDSSSIQPPCMGGSMQVGQHTRLLSTDTACLEGQQWATSGNSRLMGRQGMAATRPKGACHRWARATRGEGLQGFGHAAVLSIMGL